MRKTFGLVLLSLLLGACSSVYYGSLEKFGIEKRDLLVDRVEDSRDAQQQARERFESALEQFLAATAYDGGELETVYRTLKGEYQASEAAAREVDQRIDDVARVAEDLFDEWERELALYSDQRLRRNSERRLRETRARYGELMRAMERAASRMEPVLAVFQDRVLYLKHNLNARAIASLRTERDAVRADIQRLIEDMNTAIAEANRFIEGLEGADWPAE
ncbi:DUF2959 domain-containing protein [Alkalilimnicola sp. S0819]|uniref:DUF2959 domain-containing protein n=1 Tax=Alkalilimnicola sp. S0819 TaxID=2613922 RepID=UPI0012614E23|nr:DUF2959 domain-containing protein [Alkalilimnicola sp. S0819]KAB7619684.1 DUF2959 domain-containing protein [Alkalilimnicola sp. S0819]MPQ17541.1 DUF2959 family protein [Alkalilimnicola sp. S0819]